MENDIKAQCEFCDKSFDNDEDIEGTTFVGNYCVECHKMVIEQSRDAIKNIIEHRKMSRRKK